MMGASALTEWAQSLWDSPSWADAAREYHAQRGTNVLIVEIDPDHARFLRRVLDPDISFDRAYRAIRDRRGGK
jgi:hypothetical protein